MEIFLVILLGLAGGWVVNYLADVLPRYRKVQRPVCLSCDSEHSWTNYLLLKPCANCGQKRPLRTWVVLTISFISTLTFYFFPPVRLGFWLAALLFTYFLIVAVIDAEHKAILIPTTLFGLGLGLLTGWSIHGSWISLLGGAAGVGIMAGLFYFGKFFVKLMERIKKQEIDETALGEGDVYLMAVLGLMMGWPEVIGGLILGILLAGLFSAGMVLFSVIFRKFRAFTAIPYAPFLLLGAFIMIFLARK